MLIGAHVSPAGGPAKAVERGVERRCDAIQIFNQNPRAWRPTVYSDEQVAEFREAMAGSRVEALLIHAVYLLNAASDDPEIREKTLASLTASLRAGDALGAHAVVLHAGSAKTGEVAPAIARAGEELAGLIDAGGGSDRLGVCLDSCHMFASGYDIRTADGLTTVLDDCVAQVGLERLGSLHLNDSMTPLGSNRDRHAVVGEGELGRDGCAVFLSEPRFAGLPCVLETPGAEGSGPMANEISLTRRLRTQGTAV